MAKLGAADMRSKASAGDYAGQSRVDIFDLKIKDRKPFIIGSAESGPKVIGICYDRKSEILTYQKQGNKTVYEAKRAEVFKDKDFGGGGIIGFEWTAVQKYEQFVESRSPLSQLMKQLFLTSFLL